MAEGKLQRDPTTGKIKRNSTNGKLVRNSSGSSTCCCSEPCDYYRARRCCDDTYVDFALAAGDLPQLPFTFVYNDSGGNECWYVNSGSECVPSTAYPIISVEDVTEYDDCEDCRVTCTDCTSEDDCSCCSPCDALTPTQFTVTFSGLSVATTCAPDGCACDAFTTAAPPGVGAMKVDAWSGGTYTLTQVGGSPCLFRVLGATGPTVRFYDTCGGSEVSTHNTVNVSLNCTGGNWLIRLTHTFGGVSTGAFLFAATVDDADIDCCGLNIVSNGIGALGACPPCNPLFDPFSIGYGGQVSITPC
jgi:hypothetical protein